jgi:hypothetical protein
MLYSSAFPGIIAPRGLQITPRGPTGCPALEPADKAFFRLADMFGRHP